MSYWALASHFWHLWTWGPALPDEEERCEISVGLVNGIGVFKEKPKKTKRPMHSVDKATVYPVNVSL